RARGRDQPARPAARPHPGRRAGSAGRQQALAAGPSRGQPCLSRRGVAGVRSGGRLRNRLRGRTAACKSNAATLPGAREFPAMAEPRPDVPVLLVVAAFSRHPEALRWARGRLEEAYGPVGLCGEPFPFDQTAYYEASMGPGLSKQLLAFERLAAPDCLADVKLHTNALERELASSGAYPEERPLILDPGVLVLGKCLLATTKDQPHRVYLRDGIFAEVTLRYHAGAFEAWPWTYADYRQPHVHAFLLEAREFYRRRLREVAP